MSAAARGRRWPDRRSRAGACPTAARTLRAGSRRGRSPAVRAPLGGQTPRSLPVHRQIDDEPGARLTVGAVLDPHPSAMEADVFGHQRQTETHTFARTATTGGAAAREP